MTLIGIAAVTAVQLSGTEGSLLTSAVLSTYAVYLAYSTVSKNPSAVCNPQLGNSDPWGIAIGLGLTAISLAWTGFSWTAEGRLNREGQVKTIAGFIALYSAMFLSELPLIDCLLLIISSLSLNPPAFKRQGRFPPMDHRDRMPMASTLTLPLSIRRALLRRDMLLRVATISIRPPVEGSYGSSMLSWLSFLAGWPVCSPDGAVFRASLDKMTKSTTRPPTLP